MDYAIPPEIRQEVIQRIDQNATHWWRRDMKVSYPWLSPQFVSWFVGQDFGSVVIADDRPNKSFLYASPEGLRALSHDMGHAFGADPLTAMPTERLSDILVGLTDDPRQMAITPQWFARTVNTRAGWMRGTEKTPEVLEKLCLEPMIERTVERWRFTVHVIEYNGAVSRRIFRGTYAPFTIVDVTRQQLATPGTFSYPLEY
jgi:hypothetical protein